MEPLSENNEFSKQKGILKFLFTVISIEIYFKKMKIFKSLHYKTQSLYASIHASFQLILVYWKFQMAFFSNCDKRVGCHGDAGKHYLNYFLSKWNSTTCISVSVQTRPTIFERRWGVMSFIGFDNLFPISIIIYIWLYVVVMHMTRL